jgi:hypothetical protein
VKHVTHVRVNRNKFLLKSTCLNPRCIREDDIKNGYYKNAVLDVDWIKLSQDRVCSSLF